MTRTQLVAIKKEWLRNHCKYELKHWKAFNYKLLDNIMYIKRAGTGSHDSFNDVVIMADTETSKKNNNIIDENYVVAWTISLRAYDMNIVTLYGHKPSTFCKCVNKLINTMNGDKTIIYFHNLAYDWVFLRKFLFAQFGTPAKQLNTKPHYPIVIEWENGLILKDSLILAQRNLDKWAKDLNVEHTKAVGKWDYDKIRTQEESFSSDELEYIEHDTLAGVECLDKLKQTLHKRIYSIPYTATGIPREEARKRGKDNNAHNNFLRVALDYEQQQRMERVYHGGYTHANRHMINWTIEDGVTCYDFASSYPFVMLSEKFPSEKFTEYGECSINEILEQAEEYAFIFKLILIKPRLKNDFIPMPALQYSKCLKTVNAVLDNGRILCAEMVMIEICEQDAKIIFEQYDFDKHICSNVLFAQKNYLPRWFTDYVFELFEQKTVLKGGDPVQYALAKAKLNSLYGMCVQKPIKTTIEEQYYTGDFVKLEEDEEELYEKYLKKYNTILPYQWGVWVTAYAFRNLFLLGSCCERWVYSDTDSCYGINWNEAKISEYNEGCKKKLIDNGYGGVLHNGLEYWLGLAEYDGSYSQYRVQGAKRYCGRSVEDGELHITVAGVPKKGAICLNDNIENFAPNLIFSGKVTGKKTHTYFFVDSIYYENGIEFGDSIDLSPCDYLLNNVNEVDWQTIFSEEIEVQTYEEY